MIHAQATPWVLGMVLLADLWIMSSRDRSHTPLAGICISGCLYAGRTRHPVSYAGVLTQRDGTWIALNIHNPDAQAIVASEPPHFFFLPQTTKLGIAAPVLEWTVHSIGIHNADSASLELRAAYRAAIIRLFEAGDPEMRPLSPRVLALVRSGDGVAVRVLWLGLLHDIVFVIAMIAFFQSFAAARARREREREISANIAAASRCAQCDYDIAGLAHKGITQCPECGHTLLVTNAWRQ
jgi:DNA-directed RNA polymerase subunit RPC12/RpoP